MVVGSLYTASVLLFTVLDESTGLYTVLFTSRLVALSRYPHLFILLVSLVEAKSVGVIVLPIVSIVGTVLLMLSVLVKLVVLLPLYEEAIVRVYPVILVVPTNISNVSVSNEGMPIFGVRSIARLLVDNVISSALISATFTSSVTSPSTL